MKPQQCWCLENLAYSMQGPATTALLLHEWLLRGITFINCCFSAHSPQLASLSWVCSKKVDLTQDGRGGEREKALRPPPSRSSPHILCLTTKVHLWAVVIDGGITQWVVLWPRPLSFDFGRSKSPVESGTSVKFTPNLFHRMGARWRLDNFPSYPVIPIVSYITSLTYRNSLGTLSQAALFLGFTFAALRLWAITVLQWASDSSSLIGSCRINIAAGGGTQSTASRFRIGWWCDTS